MSVPKLRDLIGTRYITNDHVAKLHSILSQNSEIDLADCKFMPKAASALGNYYGRVIFTNSTDKALDEILKHNNKAVSVHVESEPINVYISTLSEFVNLLRTIDKTKVYNLDLDGGAKLRAISIAIVLILKFPQIKMDLGYNINPVFDRVREDWLKSYKRHESYWMLKGQALLKVDCKNGRVKLYDGTEIGEDTFVHSYMVLPYDFGNEVLWDTDEFKGVGMRALETIKDSFRTHRTMKNFIDIVK